MSHAYEPRRCRRAACDRVAPARTPRRPVRTPARTPMRRMSVGRCGAPLLAGHRTPAEVHRLAQHMAEVLVGRRAPEVLHGHVTVPVREELRRLRGSMVCAMAPRLTRVFHQPLGEGGMEASAVIDCGGRARVFAFRLRREEGGWVCTRLETDRGRR
ncbi:Rv3235 family protein [Nocardiopsis alba]|uniref:Rv3235 family protein n=1 Tax=Nocardiopsis alba TaxID=53437 RepID=UPI0037F63F4F